MYVLIGSQFEYITVMHLEIQPDPVSQRHFKSPTCSFTKNLDNLSPTSTPPSRAFKTQLFTRALPKQLRVNGYFLEETRYMPRAKWHSPELGERKASTKQNFCIVWSNIQQVHLERVLKCIQTRAIANF